MMREVEAGAETSFIVELSIPQTEDRLKCNILIMSEP